MLDNPRAYFLLLEHTHLVNVAAGGGKKSHSDADDQVPVFLTVIHTLARVGRYTTERWA